MKVKTILFIILIVVIGLFCSIGLGFFNTDTDTNKISERFDMTIDVIHVRQLPNMGSLFIVVYEKYDPTCACYEETTILVNPNSFRSQIENLNYPKTIAISGIKTDDVYNIEWMSTF